MALTATPETLNKGAAATVALVVVGTVAVDNA